MKRSLLVVVAAVAAVVASIPWVGRHLVERLDAVPEEQ